MEHAKKFQLVSLDRLQQFEDEHLSELDKKIQEILKRKQIDDSEKAKLYTQVLQKYVSFPNVNAVKISEKNPTEPELSPEKKSEVPLDKNLNIEDKILHSAPVKQKNTAKRIIDFFKQNNISWTDNREIILNNNIIYGTNVVQLVNYLLRNKKERPSAFDEFQEFLNIKNFPQEFVKNKHLNKIKTMYAKPPIRKKAKPAIKRNWLKL